MSALSARRLLLALVGSLALGLSTVSHAEDVVLFPYFDSNGENGVYLSWSVDGRNFYDVNGGQPIFTPPQWGGGQNLSRDPSIIYQDGLFHMVWTSNWSGQIFGYANSPDLVNWSTPQQVQPWDNGQEQPNNVWAPEIFYDHVSENYKVVWSSTLPSELNDGDGSDDVHGGDHRMFYVETTDFTSFGEPELIYPDLGYSVIDAHIVWDPDRGEEGGWIMNLKKEQVASRGGKNIRLAYSDPTITPGSFDEVDEPIVGAGTDILGGQVAEGSSMIKWNDEWLLYWDSYGNGHYSMASSPDLISWTNETDDIAFPVGHPRHGTVFVADGDNVGYLLSRPADLNADGEVNGADWSIFSANHLTDLSGLSSQQRQQLGDLDNDGDNDHADFLLFKQDYLASNGAGSFAAMLQAVPEPTTATLGGLLLAALGATRRR